MVPVTQFRPAAQSSRPGLVEVQGEPSPALPLIGTQLARRTETKTTEHLLPGSQPV